MADFLPWLEWAVQLPYITWAAQLPYITWAGLGAAALLVMLWALSLRYGAGWWRWLKARPWAQSLWQNVLLALWHSVLGWPGLAWQGSKTLWPWLRSHSGETWTYALMLIGVVLLGATPVVLLASLDSETILGLPLGDFAFKLGTAGAALLALGLAAQRGLVAAKAERSTRYVTAADLLGGEKEGEGGRRVPNLEARIMGMNALEGLYKEAPARYQASIIQSLAAYVRHNAPAAQQNETKEEDAGMEGPATPREDVQTALNIIAHQKEAPAHYVPLDLQHLHLQGAELENANLQRAEINGANLQEASLKNANLQEAVFRDANLHGAKLNGANLQEAKIENANLQWAEINGANLQGAEINDTNLQGAKLNDAKLQGAWLKNANLEGVELNGANLQGARLHNANLKRAGLNRANLQRAGLNDAELQGAWLKNANLQGARLHHANLQGARLENANLQGAELDHANLKEALLYQANLQGARLQNANLKGADSLTKGQLLEALFDKTTTLPAGPNLTHAQVAKKPAAKLEKDWPREMRNRVEQT